MNTEDNEPRLPRQIMALWEAMEDVGVAVIASFLVAFVWSYIWNAVAPRYLDLPEAWQHVSCADAFGMWWIVRLAFRTALGATQGTVRRQKEAHCD